MSCDSKEGQESLTRIISLGLCVSVAVDETKEDGEVLSGCHLSPTHRCPTEVVPYPLACPGLKKISTHGLVWGEGGSFGVTHHPAKSLAFQASTTSAMFLTVRPSGSFRSSLGSPLKLPQGAQSRLTKAAPTVTVTSPVGLKSTSIPDVWETVMFPATALKETALDTAVGRRVKRPFTCSEAKRQKWVKNIQDRPIKIVRHKVILGLNT